MSTKPSRRRFIAGAVCPRCALMDKIVVDLDTDQRECVSCGFVEARPDNKPTQQQTESVSLELPTRVSRAAARLTETEAEPVKLMDPGKKRQDKLA